ncbi:hypothetical protein [Streptomyces sp. NPDC090057]|uniref:hypothetical protein n=1 Tax=Streptomyces sp. NPDC090057 TaxID=3365935 RepID=UPI0038002C5A
MAIVSDLHVDIRPGFARADLDPYVDDCVLSFERGAHRPGPVICRAALERLGVRPGAGR